MNNIQTHNNFPEFIQLTNAVKSKPLPFINNRQEITTKEETPNHKLKNLNIKMLNFKKSSENVTEKLVGKQSLKNPSSASTILDPPLRSPSTYSPTTYTPPYRSGPLSPYAQQITKHQYNKNRHSNGLKHVFQDYGYRSAEEFLMCDPYDIQKALKNSFKNPKQEAIEMLVTGGNRQIRHYIDMRWFVYTKLILAEKSLEKRLSYAANFHSEMGIHLESWINYLKKDENIIFSLFEKEFHNIKYKSPTRYFAGGPWSDLADKNKWNKLWPFRLATMTKMVSGGLRQTGHELAASLRNKITTLYDLLISIAKTGVGEPGDTSSSDNDGDHHSDTDSDVDMDN